MAQDVGDIQPITPAEAKKRRITFIHPKMIETVNDLLAAKYERGTISIKKEEIVNLFLNKVPDFTKSRIFKEQHLNFESIYGKAGWEVEYHSPDRGEDYEEYFTFKPKRKRDDDED